MRASILVCGLLFAFRAFSDPTALVKSQLFDSGGIFFATGASNSAGTGLRFGLQDRVLHHLVTKHPAVISSLRDHRKCLGVAVDQFFPTAFPLLADKAVLEDQLVQWNLATGTGKSPRQVRSARIPTADGNSLELKDRCPLAEGSDPHTSHLFLATKRYKFELEASLRVRTRKLPRISENSKAARSL